MHDLDAVLHRSRLLKDGVEIERMRRAGEITAQAHREAMRVAAPGVWEYQVEAVLEYVFRAHGSVRNGYPSIVAGGANATILHYNANRQQLREGDLLLIDAGCEVDYYTADVTRTFPINGRFSAEQRAVYDTVRATQRTAIDAATVGGNIDAIHDITVRSLTEGLVDLGLLQGDIDGLIEQGDYKRFYMHRTSHWLGMDVHDVGLYSQDGGSRPLVPGMVLTVEPGLYISENDEEVDPRWRGIGVRIEDDILISEDGPVSLTSLVPTDPDEIEALCQETSRFAQLVPAMPG
jgi:Xaa-Pro aminopeptidase